MEGEGGMEGDLFIQSKKSERGFLLTPKNKDGPSGGKCNYPFVE